MAYRFELVWLSKEEYQSVFGHLLVCARLLLLGEPRLFWKEDVDKTRDEELSHDHSVKIVQSTKRHDKRNLSNRIILGISSS